MKQFSVLGIFNWASKGSHMFVSEKPNHCCTSHLRLWNLCMAVLTFQFEPIGKKNFKRKQTQVATYWGLYLTPNEHYYQGNPSNLPLSIHSLHCLIPLKCVTSWPLPKDGNVLSVETIFTVIQSCFCWSYFFPQKLICSRLLETSATLSTTQQQHLEVFMETCTQTRAYSEMNLSWPLPKQNA